MEAVLLNRGATGNHATGEREGIMEDWKKIAEKGRQILAEEDARKQEEGTAEQKLRRRVKDETIRSLKPHEYIDEYVKNIRGYFLLRKPFEEMSPVFQSAYLYSGDPDDESPRIPQLGAFTLKVEIPVPTPGDEGFAPALRFDFSVSHKEPCVIEYNRCYSMNYLLAYTYSYPRKYKRSLFVKKGILDASESGTITFGVKDFTDRAQLIDYLSGRFISVMDEGIELFGKHTKFQK